MIFWVGTPVLSVLLGDVFAALNPWRSFARVLRWAARSARGGRELPALAYPQWLGMWPAVAGIVGFAWPELVYLNREHPAALAALSLGWFGAITCGYLVFGIERCGSQGDAFGVLLQPALAAVRLRSPWGWIAAAAAGR